MTEESRFEDADGGPEGHSPPAPGQAGQATPRHDASSVGGGRDHARREPAPAFGVMLHLLGAVGLAFLSVLWAVLLLFGAVAASAARYLFAAAGFAAAVGWLVWLVHVTAGREGGEGDLGPGGHEDER